MFVGPQLRVVPTVDSAATEVVEQRAGVWLAPGGEVTVRLFESGLLIAIESTAKRASYYLTSRSHFRHLHREVAAKGVASLELTPLGEAEAVQLS